MKLIILFIGLSFSCLSQSNDSIIKRDLIHNQLENYVKEQELISNHVKLRPEIIMLQNLKKEIDELKIIIIEIRNKFNEKEIKNKK